MFKKWCDFVKSHPPAAFNRGANRGARSLRNADEPSEPEEQASHYRLLMENMNDNFTHANILVLNELVGPMCLLLKATQFSLRNPFRLLAVVGGSRN
jgi:hypothetical protein